MSRIVIMMSLMACLGCSPNTPPPAESSEPSTQQTVPDEHLSIAETYQTRVNFGARLEPANGVIHGAGQDLDSFLRYSALFTPEKAPLLQMTYVTLTKGVANIERWGSELQEALAAANGQPPVFQIGLNMTKGQDDGTGDAASVATGAYDAEIDALIHILATLDAPVYLRIGYEFEGAWNNYTSEGYVAAFQYITRKLRASKLHRVATVWCAAGGSAGFIAFDQLMAFYPGDNYVDWWGVDIFSPEEITNPWLAQFYQRANQHRKPVMIGETTPRYVGADQGKESWLRWYKPFFEMVRRHPEIKAISYINWDWAYWSDTLGFQWHDWRDARIERDALVSSRYVKELNQPFWLHRPHKAALTAQ